MPSSKPVSIIKKIAPSASASASSTPVVKPAVKPVSAPPSVAKPASAPATSKPRFMPYGDAARVLGTIAVVVGHVCDMIVFNETPGQYNWWVATFVDSASRWAVPVYIMLSGALLLDPARAETPSHFYSKRLARLGVPILFWSTFFVAFDIYFLHWRTPEQAMNDVLLGKPYAHLHFIIRIMGLYAFTPMIREFLKHASQRMVTHTVVLLLVFSSLNSIFDAYTGSELSAFLRFAPFLGFYMAGYLLRERRLSKRELYGCWALAASCVLILTGGTGLLVETFGFKHYPSLGLMLWDFLSPVRVAFAIAVWFILTNSFDQSWFESRFGRFISKWIAPATLGIYLVHPLFRELLHVNGYTAAWPNIWIGIPLVSLLVYVPSVLFTLIVMRIPYVQRIAV